jgi:thioredoxin 1
MDANAGPSRDELNALPGTTLLEFGASWCGHCQAARALIDAGLAQHPQVRHIRIEDGKGQPLGRSFTVRLWPTLILLQNGREVQRAVRPQSAEQISELLKSRSG